MVDINKDSLPSGLPTQSIQYQILFTNTVCVHPNGWMTGAQTIDHLWGVATGSQIWRRLPAKPRPRKLLAPDVLSLLLVTIVRSLVTETLCARFSRFSWGSNERGLLTLGAERGLCVL